MTKAEARQYSPLALAFVGDAVYEQLVRDELILSANMPVRKLHSLTVQKVCAEYQAAAVRTLIDKGVLSEEEQDIFRRGRNAGGVSAPKHSTVADYRAATGLECLFGYLHLIGETGRIEELYKNIRELLPDSAE
ncbi:ribonuclease III domain-containing protein [Ruminococcus sp. NK3A76]|uniref:Mini-ribonuclease 3 n=1 Tax=Ruminococcus sp. NK3A76 TaxID=877411 RepID=UPI00048C7041|nr:ribonuclease III domain-containing protein [Ruminococcus sp. NK3A76]